MKGQRLGLSTPDPLSLPTKAWCVCFINNFWICPFLSSQELPPWSRHHYLLPRTAKVF